MIKFRDELINTFLENGLDPYYNGLNLKKENYSLINILTNNLSEGISEIKKIKKSIYDGYKFYLFKWDSDQKSYINCYKNYPISINNNLINPLTYSDKIKQIRPTYIITSNPIIMKDQFESFAITVDTISIMDSFVDIDYSFVDN